MNKAIAFILLSLTLTSISASQFPMTLAEKKLYSYLTEVSKIKFDEYDVELEPWLECMDGSNKVTFFSAGLYQFGDRDEPKEAIKEWILKMIENAQAYRVREARCFYDINYFNSCGARGIFQLFVHKKNIIRHNPIHKWNWCD